METAFLIIVIIFSQGNVVFTKPQLILTFQVKQRALILPCMSGTR